MPALEIRLKKDEPCDKCSQALKTGSLVFKHPVENKYKHKECPPEWVPSKNTKPTGIDLILIVETFSTIHAAIAKKGIDMLKYEEEELVKLFWIYKQYLRDIDKKVPF